VFCVSAAVTTWRFAGALPGWSSMMGFLPQAGLSFAYIYNGENLDEVE
jgi:hypothetical protein